MNPPLSGVAPAGRADSEILVSVDCKNGALGVHVLNEKVNVSILEIEEFSKRSVFAVIFDVSLSTRDPIANIDLIPSPAGYFSGVCLDQET